MVQVLPYVPSFLEKLTPYLNQAASDIGSGIEKKRAMEGLKSLLGQQQQQGVPGQQPPQPNSASPLENLNPINTWNIFEVAKKAVGPEGAKVLVDNITQQQKMRDKEAIEIRKEERKEGRAEIEKITHGYEAAEASKANLDRMEKLEGSGKLAKPWQALVAQKTGIPLSLLANPQSEEFEKLVAQRGLNVAQAYGFGRILQTEYENFLRSIPTLMNSPDGRKRITKTLRYFDDLSIKRYNIYKQLRKESKEPVPSRLKERITEMMEPEYEKARQLLIEGNEEEKPKISLEQIFRE